MVPVARHTCKVWRVIGCGRGDARTQISRDLEGDSVEHCDEWGSGG